MSPSEGTRTLEALLFKVSAKFIFLASPYRSPYTPPPPPVPKKKTFTQSTPSLKLSAPAFSGGVAETEERQDPDEVPGLKFGLLDE